MTRDLFDPPAIVRTAEDLAGFLATANAEHEAGQRAELASLEHYRKAGEALLKAKAAAGHGKWLGALKRTTIPQQRASEYMRLAAGWDKLPPGGSFALKEALRVIAGQDHDDNGAVLAKAINTSYELGLAALRDEIVSRRQRGPGREAPGPRPAAADT
jgi:hypothetical protein